MDDTNEFIHITIEVMEQALSLYPCPFQLAIISHIIQMNNKPCFNHHIEPCLLVQGTRGGKSSVYQMIEVLTAGVTLIIESMLSLSSDQMSKISKIKQTTDGITSIQLDSIKKADQQASVVTALLSLKANTNRTIYLFASPEALTQPVWSSLIKELITKQTLNLVCIDEVHLFVQFAITFRPSIISLKSLLFDLLHSTHASNNNTQQLTVPVLFMTATFNEKMKELLTKITGLKIRKECIFWSGASSFSRRNICMNVTLTVYKMKVIKEEIIKHLRNDEKRKAIIYSNVSSQVTSMREKIDTWLDNPDSIEGDTIVINGELTSEWKLISSELFTKECSNLQDQIKKNEFVPRILLATSGCIGAGLDCPDVVVVIRDGFPTSMVDLIQEMGRCGRSQTESRENSTNMSDCFHLILSMNSLTYLIERIFIDTTLSPDDISLRESVISTNDCNELQIQHILDVVSFVFNSVQCWHVSLEQLCANKELSSQNVSTIISPCGNSCPWCNKSLSSFIKPIHKRGLIQFLVHIFIEKNFNDMTPSMLCDQLNSYKTVGTSIYGRRVNTAPPVTFLNSTILQLIGSKILKLEITRNEESSRDFTILRLNYIHNNNNEYGQLAYTIETYWVGFIFIN